MKIPKALKPYMQHCFKCGRKLILKKRWLHNYDNKTGEPTYMYKVECPKYFWFPDVIRVLFGKEEWDWHETHEYWVGLEGKLFGSKKPYTVVLERGYGFL